MLLNPIFYNYTKSHSKKSTRVVSQNYRKDVTKIHFLASLNSFVKFREYFIIECSIFSDVNCFGGNIYRSRTGYCCTRANVVVRGS